MANAVQRRKRKYNIVVMGDQYSGKTSIIERYTKGLFGPNYICTIGSEFYRKQVEIEGKPIALFLFDTAGQESMKTVIKSIYRRAQGILLVFDYTRQRTLDHIQGWIDLIESLCNGGHVTVGMAVQLEENPFKATTKNCEIMPELLLVGNKIDLPENKREVTSKSAEVFADSKDMKFFEVSAKSNYNITEAFNELSMQIYKHRKRLCPGAVAESIKVDEPESKEECCKLV